MILFLFCKIVAHLLTSEKTSQQKIKPNFTHIFAVFLFLCIKLKDNNYPLQGPDSYSQDMLKKALSYKSRWGTFIHTHTQRKWQDYVLLHIRLIITPDCWTHGMICVLKMYRRLFRKMECWMLQECFRRWPQPPSGLNENKTQGEMSMVLLTYFVPQLGIWIPWMGS